MIKNKKDNQQSLTKKILIEVLDAKFLQYDKKMDIKFDQKFAEYDKKMDTRFAEYDKKMDIKLGNFAEEVLLPGIERLLEENIRRQIVLCKSEERTRHDSQTSDLRSEILLKFMATKDRDLSFKAELIDILKQHKLLKPTEIDNLLALVR
ncbi:MAG TPA: hypothetical protein PLH37_00620 [bacterium]|nr:hypothetical protein [bacterium]